jgi:cytochrome P450/NADPH-cytochrome P450 reductase
VEIARPAAPQQGEAEKAVPLQVLFGSNGGSAQGFAQRIANDATSHGHDASLGTLDSAVGRLSPDRSVVIVAASYEGHPTDDARQFIAWLDRLPADALRGVRYAVFGCGNRDWVRTFQAVPTHIDQALQAAGATRILPRGQADARGDFFSASSIAGMRNCGQPSAPALRSRHLRILCWNSSSRHMIRCCD